MTSIPQNQPPAVGAGGQAERTRLAERAEGIRRALVERPRFSLRLQMYLGFLAAFILSAGVAVALVYNFHDMENKIRFLEIVNDYVMEVEQARRFEKNFLLYGSNLSDALDSVFQAEQILTRNAGELAAVMGPGWSQVMLPKLRGYQALLERLGRLQGAAGAQGGPARQDLQARVRKEGQEMVSAALALLSKEKASLSTTTRRSRQILIYSLALLLVVLVLNAYLLGIRMLGSINRFGEYANRIAAGDYTPITPSRRYRDEFTDLALAINAMIQELENREAVLIQSHKMRAVGTLTSGVAHELNNPLNNITLTAHVLQEDYAGLSDAERQEMIADVVQEAGRAKKIISNLLDFARETGSQLEPLDLPHLLQETIDLAANQIKLLGIKIQLQSSDNLPRVHGDSQQLRQVFLNLILNAIDASAKGGKIQVIVVPADEPNYVAVKVIDFGSGIPAHILPSLFDPFFTTKGRGKGTGLGLSVSQGIVAKHGGRIMVSSQAGQGATFTVVLPVTTIPAELGEGRHPEPANRAKA
ncbi:MAG: sensor histidine kinase [Desulfarculus sp.]|nr:MAG: sensor histidine kinase [Desulfarculus sp.]